MSKEHCKTKGCGLFPYKDGFCYVCVKKGLNKRSKTTQNEENVKTSKKKRK